MNKRSAIVISGTMVMALLAGMVGASRAIVQQSSHRPVVVVRGAAPAAPVAPVAPAYQEQERE